MKFFLAGLHSTLLGARGTFHLQRDLVQAVASRGISQRLEQLARVLHLWRFDLLFPKRFIANELVEVLERVEQVVYQRMP
jgi:hypothetical protein